MDPSETDTLSASNATSQHTQQSFENGHLYGAHRVVAPDDSLPLDAAALSNTPPLYANEMALQVSHLIFLPSTLRTYLAQANDHVEDLKKLLLEEVRHAGKLGRNGLPIGWLIGSPDACGPHYSPLQSFSPRAHDTHNALDHNASKSLFTQPLLVQSDASSIPLDLQSIHDIDPRTGIATLSGTAYLVPSHSLLEFAIPLSSKGAISEVSLPLLFGPLRKLLHTYLQGARRILVLGSSSAALVALSIARQLLPFASLYACDSSTKNLSPLHRAQVIDVIGEADLCDPVSVMDVTYKMTGNEPVDLVVHASFLPHTYLSAILPLQPGGRAIEALHGNTDPLACAAASVGKAIEVHAPFRNILTQAEYDDHLTSFQSLIRQTPALGSLL